MTVKNEETSSTFDKDEVLLDDDVEALRKSYWYFPNKVKLNRRKHF